MTKVYVIIDWENSDIFAVYRSKTRAIKDYREQLNEDMVTIVTTNLK